MKSRILLIMIVSGLIIGIGGCNKADIRNGTKVTERSSRVMNKDGLAVRYDFIESENNKVADKSGRGFDGTLEDGAKIVNDKYMGRVLELNGDGAYFRLPDNILDGMESYSVSTFVNIGELSTWARIFDFGSSPGQYIFLTASGGGGKMIWDTNDTRGVTSVNTENRIPVNSWCNVTCTYEAGVSIIYLNGYEITRKTGGSPYMKRLWNTGRNYIGKSQFSADPSINAKFADFRIYGRAIAQKEVIEIVSGKINTKIAELENIEKNIKVGERLSLPQYIKGTTTDGKTENVMVFWDNVSEGELKKGGTITVKGRIGGSVVTAEATVNIESMSINENYSIDINISGEMKKDNSREINTSFDVISLNSKDANMEFRVEFYDGDKLFDEIKEIKKIEGYENKVTLRKTIADSYKDKSYDVRAYVMEKNGSEKTAVSKPKIKYIKPIGTVNEIESQMVRLDENGLFGISQKTGLDYVLRLDPDRLIAPCYEGAGRAYEAKGPRYGGWESMQIAGHSLGHYLSALADLYASTGNETAKQRMEYVVSELKKIQREDGYIGGVASTPFDTAFTGNFQVEAFSLNGYWVPWYSVHKIYAGLIDAYKIGGSKEALEIVKKMADWAYEGSKNMTDEQFQRMLLCEHGGMNEVMADLYAFTKEDKYLYLAKRFTQTSIISPLSKGIDSLQGLHANTQIPKIIGAARIYELTGSEYYGNAAKFFFETVVGHRSFVIGGNSVSEHFGPSDKEVLARDSCETCNTYNMLKLAEHIFSWEKDSRYIDYYERALMNHILASQDPETGAKTYFVSTYPGHFKVYGTDEDAFWCCTGTGMENPGRYNRFIYYRENDDIYVNLFISSVLELKDKGIKLEQTGNFPYSDTMAVNILESAGAKANIKIRVPYWINGKLTAAIGNETYESGKEGYLTISREWKKGDKIIIKAPMGLHQYTSMDNANKIAVMYGPVVLSAALGNEEFPAADIVPDHLSLMGWGKINVPKIVTDETDLEKWINIVDMNKLIFETADDAATNGKKLLLKPFYDTNHERYTIYLDKFTKAEYSSGAETLKTRDELLEEITMDVVKAGEQQSEIEHKFQSENSFTGYLPAIDMRWRDARNGGFITYTMKADTGETTGLMVTYYDKDKSLPGAERIFDILVNGTKIKEVELKGSGKDKAVEFIYDIPEDVIDKAVDAGGRKLLEISFRGKAGAAFAGGILEVRTVKNNKR